MVDFLQENKSLNGKKCCFYISLVFCCPSVRNIRYLCTHIHTHRIKAGKRGGGGGGGGGEGQNTWGLDWLGSLEWLGKAKSW